MLLNVKEKHKIIKRIYKNRCIICSKKGVVVHEIIFRSHGEQAYNPNNMVLLCAECHEKCHSDVVYMKEKLKINQIKTLAKYYPGINFMDVWNKYASSNI